MAIVEATPIHRVQEFRMGDMPSINDLAFKEGVADMEHPNNGQDISEIIQRYKDFIDEVKQKQLRGVV